jgi:hypothetical protein
VPPDKNLVQWLVQEDDGIRKGIKSPKTPGGDPRQWTLSSLEKSRTSNPDLYPYTVRYYMTFNDGSGSLVKISGNYDPHSGGWHGRTFHFASGQPAPRKWGRYGTMRNPPDPGTDENPISNDIDELLDLFGSE